MAGRRSASPESRRKRRKSPRRAAGERVEGTARVLNSSADAVVDTALGPVLAAGALPGERVQLVDVRRQGAVRHGRIEAWLSRSEERVEASCPHATECGGCPLGVATPTLERRIKSDLVARALRIFPEAPKARWVESPTRDGYRSRARLHFRDGVIGYRSRRGRALVDVSRCEVLVPALADALTTLRRHLAPALRGGAELRLGLGADGAALVVIEAGSMQPPALYAVLAELIEEPCLAGVVAVIGGCAPALFGETAPHVLAADGLALRLPAGGFAQAQDAVNHDLARHVATMSSSPGRRVLELYAGAGNLSVLLARGAASFESVERSADAVDSARENLRSRELAGKLRCGSADELAAGDRVDVVVLDPPREGALRALPHVIARRPQRVVYVSCQPSTLGRDLRVLADAGYAPSDVTAFDMFPKTAHLECVVTLEKK